LQNLIDLFAAGFVFLLFASVYRKRSTAAVRFWMVGWFFILLHFAALCCRFHSPAANLALDLCSLNALLLCGIAFVLSREEVQASVSRQVRVAGLLGGPWLGAVVFAGLPEPSLAGSAVCAALGSLSILVLAVRVFRARRSEALCIVAVAAGCLGWLVVAVHTGNANAMVPIVLTECFGLNAVLLSFGRSRVSAATLTTSAGAIAWGLVWVSASLLEKIAPGLNVNLEVWNLPKYLVATGRILTLLEEEIRSAALELVLPNTKPDSCR